MKELFPTEIVEYTSENYWIKRHIRSKIIYLVIIGLLIVTICVLPLIYIDLSTQSRGSIRSVNENNSLQSPITAEISQIRLQENQEVKKGDTLIWLKIDAIKVQQERIKEKLSENCSFVSDIQNLLLEHNYNIVTPKYRAEYNQYISKLREQEVNYKQAEKELTVSKKLYQKGVESQFDYNQIESRYQTARSSLSSAKSTFISNWQAEKTRLELENKDLQSELEKLHKEKSQYYIIAPASGRINQYSGILDKNFIIAGQTIAQIVTDQDLIIECYISPSDIGYIHEKQNVNIQMDAFDYRQWGLLSGIVSEIMPDVTMINDQPFFRVRCQMKENFLQLKNGYKGYLKRGMTLTGRFMLTKRSLADLIFDEVDNWLNPKLINHEN